MPPEPPKGAGPDEIIADIERTRAHLGDTVEELADRATARGREAAYLAGGLVAAAAVLVAAALWWRRRRAT